MPVKNFLQKLCSTHEITAAQGFVQVLVLYRSISERPILMIAALVLPPYLQQLQDCMLHNGLFTRAHQRNQLRAPRRS